ncbi:MAG: hypothetical protein LBI96_07100 [Odoribacteraceae bacterium]|jgi:hypothetical protein|nr:hypothetical protein [Odoribacteraceae bacterium]
MKEEPLLKCFIETMRLKINPGENLAVHLTGVLPLGKEAIYRRLRGEVPFTFGEVALIAGNLGISLDELLGVKLMASIPFYFSRSNDDDAPLTRGYGSVREMRGLIDEAREDRDPESRAGVALNTLPVALMMKHAGLLRFRAFKLLYQEGKDDPPVAYGEVTSDERLLHYGLETYLSFARVGHVCVVIDRMIFAYMVNDVRSFALAGLLTGEEVALIKSDLLALVDELERITATGRNEMGNTLEFYLSDVNFESTYTYISSRGGKWCSIAIFSTNSLYSLHANMFEAVKEWVDSLKQLSCLITKAGEVYRWQFFKRQRELVGEL